jgi:hypothetical protein
MDLRLVYKKSHPSQGGFRHEPNQANQIKSNKGTNEWLLIVRQSSSLGILHWPRLLQ